MSREESEERERSEITVRKDERWKRYALYAGVVLMAFLLGLIPMWLSARERASERDQARRELHLSRIKNNLATAAIDARLGHYESARKLTSDFYTELRNQVDAAGENSIYATAQRDALRPLLEQRDDLITLLARSDPASADRLSNLYLAYRKALGEEQTPGAN